MSDKPPSQAIHDHMCGFGLPNRRCGKPATFVFAAGTHASVYDQNDEVTRCIMLCAEHANTPPSQWGDNIPQPRREPSFPPDVRGDRPDGCAANVCLGIECMNECSSSHRLQRYAQLVTKGRTEEATT